MNEASISPKWGFKPLKNQPVVLIRWDSSWFCLRWIQLLLEHLRFVSDGIDLATPWNEGKLALLKVGLPKRKVVLPNHHLYCFCMGSMLVSGSVRPHHNPSPLVVISFDSSQPSLWGLLFARSCLFAPGDWSCSHGGWVRQTKMRIYGRNL